MVLGSGPGQAPYQAPGSPPPTHDLPQRSERCAVSLAAPIFTSVLCWSLETGNILPRPVSPPGLEAVFLAAGEVSSYL